MAEGASVTACASVHAAGPLPTLPAKRAGSRAPHEATTRERPSIISSRSSNAVKSGAAPSPPPLPPRQAGRESSASRGDHGRKPENHLFKIVQRIEARLRGDV